MCPWFWQGERSKSCAQFIASLVCIAFVNCGEDKEQWSFPLVHPIFNQIGPFYMTGQRVASQIIRCYQTFDVSSQSLPLWRYMTVSNRRTLTIYEFRSGSLFFLLFSPSRETPTLLQMHSMKFQLLFLVSVFDTPSDVLAPNPPQNIGDYVEDQQHKLP